MMISKVFLLRLVSFIISSHCESENIASGRSYNEQSVIISYCSFSRSSQLTGNGGVISISSSEYSLSVTQTIFYFCTSSSNGGAIYFSSSTSFLNMICADKCGSASGNFAYFSTSTENYIGYLSILNSYHISNELSTLCTFFGDQNIKGSNSSFNQALYYSSLRIASPVSVTCSFSSFYSNSASEYSCIGVWKNSGEISYCNVVGNNSPKAHSVILSYDGAKVTFKYSIFKQNLNKLFASGTGSSITITSSFISHTGDVSSGSVTAVNNNSFISTKTYCFQFYQTQYCKADNPVVIPTHFSVSKPSFITLLALLLY